MEYRNQFFDEANYQNLTIDNNTFNLGAFYTQNNYRPLIRKFVFSNNSFLTKKVIAPYSSNRIYNRGVLWQFQAEYIKNINISNNVITMTDNYNPGWQPELVNRIEETSNILEFSTEEAYSVGNLVYYESAYYVFITDHNKGEWNLSDVNIINEYSNNTAYSVNSYVTYNDAVWRFKTSKSKSIVQKLALLAIENYKPDSNINISIANNTFDNVTLTDYESYSLSANIESNIFKNIHNKDSQFSNLLGGCLFNNNTLQITGYDYGDTSTAFWLSNTQYFKMKISSTLTSTGKTTIITGRVASDLIKELIIAPEFIENTYYSAPNQLVVSKPDNWDTTYMNYFTDAEATIPVSGISTSTSYCIETISLELGGELYKLQTMKHFPFTTSSRGTNTDETYLIHSVSGELIKLSNSSSTVAAYAIMPMNVDSKKREIFKVSSTGVVGDGGIALYRSSALNRFNITRLLSNATGSREFTFEYKLEFFDELPLGKLIPQSYVSNINNLPSVGENGTARLFNLQNGTKIYIENLKTNAVWNGADWEIGASIGESSNRPNIMSGSSIGSRYFDTSLNKPVYWTGTAWVDPSSVNREAITETIEGVTTVNSLGYKILDPSVPFASQVTEPNTIYEVRDKFDLGSQTVVLGSNITLNFNGGKIVNGTIKGDKTIIKSASYQIFDNITFSGNFINTLNASWIGAKEGDTTFDNSFVIQQWFNSYSTVFKTLEFDYGSYTFKTPVTLNTDKRNLKILGNNSLFRTIIPDNGDNGQFFITLQGTLQGSSSGGESFALESIRFSNNDGTLSKTRCIMLNRTQRFSIKDVYISYYDVAIWIRNCFYGGFYGSVALVKNRIGVYADSSDTSTESITWHEVNGIDFHNVNINGCTTQEAKTLWTKKDGESEDDYNMRVAVCGIDFHAVCNGCKFYGITLEHLNYGIRFSYKPYSSAQTLINDVVTIDSCYFEAIDTYAIYSGKGYINNPNSLTYIFKIIHNIVISNCRFASDQDIYLKYGNTYFLNNQIASIMLDGDSGGNTYLVYNGSPNVTIGRYSAAHKTDAYFTQSSLYTNSYQQLNALVRSRGHITTATLDLSRSSNYNINDPIFIEEGSIGISPTYRIGDIIYPCSIKKYNKDIYARVSMRSGASEHLFISSNSRETLNIGSTRLRTFVSDWLNNTVKTYFFCRRIMAI